MAYDSDEFKAPILKDDQVTVELLEDNDSVTVELLSPISFQYENSTGMTPIPFTTQYIDLYDEYWFYNPMMTYKNNLELKTTDPYHLTITRTNKYSKPTNFSFELTRVEENMFGRYRPVGTVNVIQIK